MERNKDGTDKEIIITDKEIDRTDMKIERQLELKNKGNRSNRQMYFEL